MFWQIREDTAGWSRRKSSVELTRFTAGSLTIGNRLEAYHTMKGTIRQRSPGSWEIQVFLGRDTNGKRIRKTETVRGKKSDAQRRLREILSEVDRGAIPANTRYRVGEWLDKWLDEKQVGGRREKTIDRYEGIIRLHLEPTLGRVELAKLSPMQIKDLELELGSVDI